MHASNMFILLAAAWSRAAVATEAAPEAQAQPQTLMQAPADPISYYDAKLRVRAFVWDDEGEAAAIEPLAERLVAEFPLDGENWDLLARVRSNLGKHEQAAAAWEKAGPLIGWGMTHSPGFNAAQMYALARRRREALDLVRTQIVEGRTLLRREMFDWDEFHSLRDDPEFRELAGRIETGGWSRDYGWRRDLEFLRDEVKRVNPDFHDAPFPVEFSRRYEALREAIPRLSDEEILVGMNRLLAALGQGHTWLWDLPDEHPGQQRLPVRFYAFPEGLFVVAATQAHQDLVGTRVLAFGETPAAEAMRRASAALGGESDMFRLFIAPGLLRRMSFLNGLGMSPGTASADLDLQLPDGTRRTVRLDATSVPLSSSFNLLPAPPGAPAPLFLSDQTQKHWHRALPEQNAFYVQLYNVHDEADETLAAYGQRLRAELRAADPANLILDMRHNTGGTTALYTELLRTIVGFSQQPGKQVYVLIGRATYSAAANLVTDLERLAGPVFVGEPTSQCCNFAGDPSPVVLPYSRASGVVSAVRWNLSRNVFDGRREISPEVPAQLSAADYFAGRDPALEAVFRLIRDGGPRSTGGSGH